uniref:Progonadoliberin n=1 Tax=Ornithorhynchus anatinus TaxID=9258 RepID=A0A6I8N1P8_ORNAN
MPTLPLVSCLHPGFLTGFILLVVFADTGSGQHWSHGLRPGGKRDLEGLGSSFPEVISASHSFFFCLGGYISLLEGEQQKLKFG